MVRERHRQLAPVPADHADVERDARGEGRARLGLLLAVASQLAFRELPVPTEPDHPEIVAPELVPFAPDRRSVHLAT